MQRLTRSLSLLPFVTAILLGAFLVFQVQPIISKAVLPWFGGTPAVWTTCMLFFQVLLFAGYLYAHLLNTYLSRRAQGIVHVILLGIAVLSLPIAPSSHWKPDSVDSPVLYLLMLLGTHVGLPYFALSSTGPLVQAWLAGRNGSTSVYRLYAFSNIGSLTALISYPLIVEPLMRLNDQSTLWSVLFCVFVVVQSLIALFLGGTSQQTEQTEQVLAKPSSRRQTAWLMLPALASVMLLAVTSHVCTDVAVIPFLWILPLVLYLLSFIICFDRPGWYQPRLWAQVALGSVVGMGLLVITKQNWLVVEAGLAFTLFMSVCMMCHGEVARLKPYPRFLTKYYLMLSAGGALGGLSVGILCPIIFSGYSEYPIGIGASVCLAVLLLIGYPRNSSTTRGVATTGHGMTNPFRVRKVRSLQWYVAGSCALLALFMMDNGFASAAATRNFFGVLRIVQYKDNGATTMMHGRTLHGFQLPEPNDRLATAYYSTTSGVGRLLTAIQQEKPSARIGVIGLGVGTLSVYGRASDQIEFFEINPEVTRLAGEYFTCMSNSPADISVQHGDGRLLLESDPTPRFDALVIDAFSSDAVPAHLLTREALAMYKSTLRPGGAIAMHVSNRHLDLAPIVHRLAQDAGMRSKLVSDDGDHPQYAFHSEWILLASHDAPIWQELQFAADTPPVDLSNTPLWTDQYHDLLRILRWRSE